MSPAPPDLCAAPPVAVSRLPCHAQRARPEALGFLPEADLNLILQGLQPFPFITRTLTEMTGATLIEPLSRDAVRLVGASPDADFLRYCRDHAIDVCREPMPHLLADYRVFVSDMDSTLINIECIDEVADFAGCRDEVAGVTEAAMRGELDFRAALEARVALLAGLPVDVLARVFDERLALSPGADILLHRLREEGIRTVLVSGGFTYFTERLQAMLGFDETWANTLEVADGRLTGRLTGPIIDAQAKADILRDNCRKAGCGTHRAIAVGDGANDVPMLRAAGLSIAFRGKRAARDASDIQLDHVGLDGLLNVLR